ncbi:MAG TPA: hypothetical protein DEQ24_01765 [Enterococcus sp.]|nr:hypothetical protein [Enterococcus sp.]
MCPHLKQENRLNDTRLKNNSLKQNQSRKGAVAMKHHLVKKIIKVLLAIIILPIQVITMNPGQAQSLMENQNNISNIKDLLAVNTQGAFAKEGTAAIDENDDDFQEITFSTDTYKGQTNQTMFLEIQKSKPVDSFTIRLPEEAEVDTNHLENDFTIEHEDGEYWRLYTHAEKEMILLPVIFTKTGEYFISVDDDSNHMYFEITERVDRTNLPIEVKEDSNLEIPEDLITIEKARILDQTLDASRSTSTITNWSQFRSAWNSTVGVINIGDNSIMYSSSIFGDSLNERRSSVYITSESPNLSINAGPHNFVTLGGTTFRLNVTLTNNAYPGVGVYAGNFIYAIGTTLILENQGHIMPSIAPTAVHLQGSTLDFGTGDKPRRVVSSNGNAVTTNQSSRIIMESKGSIISNGARDNTFGATNHSATIIIKANNVMMAGAGNVTMSGGNYTFRPISNFNQSWNHVDAHISNEEMISTMSSPDDFGSRYLANHRLPGYQSLHTEATAAEGFVPSIIDYSLKTEAFPEAGGLPITNIERLETGGKATINARPNKGYQFVKWEIVSGSGSSIANAMVQETTFTMGSSDAVVRAVFEEEPPLPVVHTLTLQGNPNIGGAPTASQTKLAEGEIATIQARPNSWYTFLRWDFVSLRDTLQTNTIATMFSSEEMDVSPDTFNHTQSFFGRTSVASPNGAQINDRTNPTTTVKMGTGDEIIEAVYERKSYQLSVSAEPKEAGNPKATQSSFDDKTVIQLDADVNPGYEFVEWVLVEGGNYAEIDVNDLKNPHAQLVAGLIHNDTSGDIMLQAKYRKLEPAEVTVIYIDEDKNHLLPSEVIKGNYGDSYTARQREIIGWLLKDIPENITGTITEEKQTVTFEYKRNNNPTGDIYLNVVNSRLNIYYANVNNFTIYIDGEIYETYSVANRPTVESIVLDIPVNEIRNKISIEYRDRNNQLVRAYWNDNWEFLDR